MHYGAYLQKLGAVDNYADLDGVHKFYHRDLRCLVAFELKTGRFEPEHMGKLAFYLEALDRDRKRRMRIQALAFFCVERKMMK